MKTVLIVTLSLIPVAGAAQTVTGTMQGTVRDASGAVLPGVSISAKSTETGQTRETVTNDVGYYSLPFLQIGSL